MIKRSKDNALAGLCGLAGLALTWIFPPATLVALVAIKIKFKYTFKDFIKKERPLLFLAGALVPYAIYGLRLLQIQFI